MHWDCRAPRARILRQRHSRRAPPARGRAEPSPQGHPFASATFILLEGTPTHDIRRPAATTKIGHPFPRNSGWAKAECDEGMKLAPASPQPRASLLYNEALIARQAGDIEGARTTLTQSLSLRENAEVRAALNSLPASASN